jgi:beta-lactamase regulating signal transducer with metallopeptidase domain
MHEHIARVLYHCQIHLLYASAVGLAAWALTSIRRGSATTKYWIWVAAALHFVVPVGAVLDKIEASHLSWARPLGVVGDFANNISDGMPGLVIGIIWLTGASVMFVRLIVRLRAESRHAQAAGPAALPASSLLADLPVRFTATRQGPAVEGVLHPQISLPRGIERVLSERELDAVLLHEMRHAKRRDNLIRLFYELALCALWFHPLVWLAGARLALYREMSCDESVIAQAHGEELVSALAKLAEPEEVFLLQAGASSFLSHRLERLSAPTRPASRVMSAMLTLAFVAFLAWSVFSTMAHTACCFVHRP